jgi:hypothetical protein
MLGRGRLMLELCLLRLLPAVSVAAFLVAVVEMLARLAERPSGALGTLPARDRDSRGTLNFVAEAAVCVVSPGGSLTGRVGDLTLGLTNPVLLGEGCRGGGLFTEDDPDAVAVDAAGFVVLVAVRGVAARGVEVLGG